MIDFVYTHRVRYREVDPMGIVYHAHYVDYFEHARTEMLRELGLSYKSLEEAGIMMPVVDLDVQYRRPAKYDDLLAITALIEDPPSSRIQIAYEVRRHGEDEILVSGHVTLCFVDRARRRPMPAPEQVRELFDRAFDAPKLSSE